MEQGPAFMASCSARDAGGAGVVDDPVEPTARLLALLRLDQTDHDTVRQAGFGGCLCDGHDFGIMGSDRNFTQSKNQSQRAQGQ